MKSTHDVYTSLLKREFKIAGTIGSDHQKDNLSLVGLIRESLLEKVGWRKATKSGK